MSGLLFLALGLLLAQALPDDAPPTSSTHGPATGQPTGASSASPQAAPASSDAGVAGQQGLDGTVRASPPTQRMSSLPDATSPGTTWSAEGPGSAGPSEPDSSASTSSRPGATSEPPEHSSLAAQKPSAAQAMSSGVVALVMAVVFALLVVIVYAGLLLWRRYLEYRYGNRELLVNDLEFDTGDLRHFEL